MNSLYIHPEILGRFDFDQFNRPANQETILERPHEILKHATNRINAAKSDDDLIDGICALKRAVLFRSEALRSVYKMKALPITGFPNKQFEQLCELGIIRPLLLDSLLEVRRLVEHRGDKPPPKKRCQELAEFAWYFLRATDVYVTRVTNGMIAILDWKPTYEVSVSISPNDDWKIEIDGTLPKGTFSINPRPEWHEIKATECYSTADDPYTEDRGTIFRRDLSSYNADDIHFSGMPCPGFASALVRKYFSIIG